MKPEMPVFAARATGTRFSTARKTAMEKCWYGAAVLPNQASFVIVVITISAP